MKFGATAGRVGVIPGARGALRQNVYPIVNVLAAVVMVFSITMLVPLVLALARRDDGMPGFVTSAAVCFSQEAPLSGHPWLRTTAGPEPWSS